MLFVHEQKEVFIQPFLFGQDVKQGQFLSEVKLIWIQSFPSLRQVALSRINKSVCPTIHCWREKRDGFMLSITAKWNANSSATDSRMWLKVNFKTKYSWFELRVFLPQDHLPYPGERVQTAWLFTHSWTENNWDLIFPKGIRAMWNAVSFRIWSRVAESFSNDNVTLITPSNIYKHSQTDANFWCPFVARYDTDSSRIQ